MPPSAYSAKPIRGLVVDAESGKPLEGVIVVVQWVLKVATVGGQNPRSHLEVSETVTGSGGTYTFPGWGPKPNPVTIDLSKGYLCCFLDSWAPQLSFFKPGYTPITVVNRYESNDPVRTSEWDGKTVKLQKLTGAPDEWAKHLRSLQITLGWGHLMDWHLLPRMTLALELERLGLENTPIAKRGLNISGLYALGTTIEEVRRFLEAQK